MSIPFWVASVHGRGLDPCQGAGAPNRCFVVGRGSHSRRWQIQALAGRAKGGEVSAVPYSSNAELPTGVRRHLPGAAQDIYREAFNHAWDSYADDPRREEIAHRVAWAAVKRKFRKVDGDWVALTSTAAR
jgi:cation transport regulator